MGGGGYDSIRKGLTLNYIIFIVLRHAAWFLFSFRHLFNIAHVWFDRNLILRYKII